MEKIVRREIIISRDDQIFKVPHKKSANVNSEAQLESLVREFYPEFDSEDEDLLFQVSDEEHSVLDNFELFLDTVKNNNVTKIKIVSKYAPDSSEEGKMVSNI